MTSHFTGTTRKKKMESRKTASEEVRLQTTAKNRQRGCRRDVRRHVMSRHVTCNVKCKC